jgi:hypothetical protein
MKSLPILKPRTIKKYDQGSWDSFTDQLVAEEHFHISNLSGDTGLIRSAQ